MDTQPSSASHARRGASPRSGSQDWRPGQGLIDRMLAYRDWWNIPSRRGGASRAQTGRRPSARAGGGGLNP